MRSLLAFPCSALAFIAACLLIERSAAAAVEPAAASATEGGLRIESSTCPHPLVEEVQHLARVELNSAGMPEGDNAPHVILSCSGRVILIRARLVSGEDSRQLDLDQTDDTLRARVIALAIAELVRDTASRAPPPAAPAPVPASSPPPAAPPPPLLPANGSKNRLVLFGKVSNFGSSFQPLYGGGLGFSHDLGRFALGLGPSIVQSKNEGALGAVRVLAADLSLRLSLRFPSAVLPAEIGVGHAFGLARLVGTSDRSDARSATVSGVWTAPFLFGGFEAHLGQPWFLQLAAQLGVVTIPVRGYVARESDVGMVGLWGGLSLGIGLNL